MGTVLSLKPTRKKTTAKKRKKSLTEHPFQHQLLSTENSVLLKVMELKREILRHASHDLRSPLSSIKGIANMILHSLDDKKRVNEYVSMIEEAADQMLQLVNDIHQASLVESGFVNNKPVLFDLTAQVRLCANSFFTQLQKKNQSIRIKTTKPVYAYGDKEKIFIVLSNLISNACKFSYLNQKIVVKLSQSNDTAHCEIIDEGQGLTKSDMKSIFQPFKSLTAKPTGLEETDGLGLYISMKLTEANNGKIWAESDGRNKGSRFIFELPNCAPMNSN